MAIGTWKLLGERLLKMTHHGSIGNQAHQGVRRQKTQTDDQRLSKSLEILQIQTGVDDIEEDGRNLRWAGERILDSGVFREKLSREVGAGDVLVMGRESIALKTEGADPEFSADVDLA